MLHVQNEIALDGESGTHQEWNTLIYFILLARSLRRKLLNAAFMATHNILELLLTWDHSQHSSLHVLGCSWGRFWYLIDEFRSRSNAQNSTVTASAATVTPSLKQSDERFRQFFWNNFIQEDDTHFYNHTKPGPSGVQDDVVRKSQVAVMAIWLQFYYHFAVIGEKSVQLFKPTTTDICEHHPI